jgi:hypothetical protein
MKFKLLIILLLFNLSLFSQTVIEMSDPGDASLIFLEVKNKDSADIIVYKTNLSKEARELSLKWKFRKWGFCDYTIYLAKDTSELYTQKFSSYTDKRIRLSYFGKIYFTEDTTEVKYNRNFSSLKLMKIKKIKIIVD